MDGFDALADPTRRDLLRRLAHGPARVVDLTAAYPMTRPAVSRHLRILTEAGLASAQDRGRERHYRLDAAGLAPVRRFVEELVELDARTADLRTNPIGARVGDGVLDALDTEVRRTVRDHRASRSAGARERREDHEEAG